jgi:hypothetical protein
MNAGPSLDRSTIPHQIHFLRYCTTPRLLVVQQRLSLPVRLNDMSLTSDAITLAKHTRYADQHRQDGQTSHNDESEDPLKGHDMGGQLRKRQRCTKLISSTSSSDGLVGWIANLQRESTANSKPIV